MSVHLVPKHAITHVFDLLPTPALVPASAADLSPRNCLAASTASLLSSKRYPLSDDVLGETATAEEEDLDERAGAVAVPFAVGLVGSVPPDVVDGSEPACGAGLVERGRSRQGAGIGDESFQVVIQYEAGAASGDPPFVQGDLSRPS